MTQARNETITQETRKQIAQWEALGWYHSLELPDGTVLKGLQSIDLLKKRLAQFPLPADLRGKRVLDIGAWDGWFTFEMERRGASVAAFDLVRNEKFLLAQDLLGSKADYIVSDLCKVSTQELGRFDIVLFLGVLYHLKHPLLALEKVCEMTKEIACIESYVIDGGEDLSAPPVLEFYEGTELRGQFDNWVGLNVSCLLAMARAAGFAEVRLESVFEQRAHLTCRRKWSTAPGDDPAPYLLCIENCASRDHDFSVQRDDYVSLWFRSEKTGLSCGNVYIEIGPYAARPAQVTSTGMDGWNAVCKLSPGLDSGWHQVRLRVEGSQFSNAVAIPVDLPAQERIRGIPVPLSRDLRIALITDGKTWERWKVAVGVGSCLSLWAAGIPDGCEPGQIVVTLGGANLPASFLSKTDADGRKQVNAILPPGLRRGKTDVRLLYGGSASEPVEIELISASTMV